MFRPRSGNEWAFIGATAAQATCIIVLDLFILLEYLSWVNPVVYQVPRSYVIPVNFGIFVLGNVYQAILAFDGVRMKNNLQLFSICVFNICLFIFSVMRHNQTYNTIKSLNKGEALYNRPFTDRSIDFWAKTQPPILISIILVGVCSFHLCFFAYKLHHEFAWAIYRHVSGSPIIRRRYLAYEVLLVLMKLEIYFLIGFIIIYGLIDVHYELPEFPLTISIIPVAFIQIALTVYSTKFENKLGAFVGIIIRLGEIAYLISRIIILNGSGMRAKTILKDEMLLFAIIALVFAISACLNAGLCIANFGRGLKPLYPNWKQRESYEFEPVHNLVYLPERLELD